MKTILILLLLFSTNIKAQFIGFGVNRIDSKIGGSYTMGFDNSEVLAQYNYTINSVFETHTISFGPTFGNKWNVTPLLGYTILRGKKVELYNSEKEMFEIVRSRNNKFYYGTELGFTKNAGKAFLLMDRNGYTLGMKCLINEL